MVGQGCGAVVWGILPPKTPQKPPKNPKIAPVAF